jgi:hypothetical protein
MRHAKIDTLNRQARLCNTLKSPRSNRRYATSGPGRRTMKATHRLICNNHLYMTLYDSHNSDLNAPNLKIYYYLPFMKPTAKFISRSVFIPYDADSDLLDENTFFEVKTSLRYYVLKTSITSIIEVFTLFLGYLFRFLYFSFKFTMAEYVIFLEPRKGKQFISLLYKLEWMDC